MTEGPAPLAEALAARYSLEREVARGGMATVYLARDLRHGRSVALKVMHASLADALDSRRFVREIEIAASLAHPLIVPLYESGDAGGVLYYTMPYVEGESLYERLQRERQLPLDDALQIARDVADALGYAHERGVLHRDVKPENILLAGGRAQVADFGLARAIGIANYRKLTETGVIVGTVYYMSPEQIREDRDLDERTDVYSLGCILYEMLTGEPPYTASSLVQLVKRIVSAPVPSARRLRPTLPPEVDQAIAKAMAKSAAQRFATMREFAAALPPAQRSETPVVPAAPAGAPASTRAPTDPGATPGSADSAPSAVAAHRTGGMGALMDALRALLSRLRSRL